jgi:hypothetical protein
MINSFNVISILALAVMASASTYEPAYSQPEQYAPPPAPVVAPTGATTTTCTDETPGYTPVPAPSVYAAPPAGYVAPPPSYETTTYTSVYTSCEALPTVYTSEGIECTSTTSKTHYLTTTVCDTTEVAPAPTTIYHSYETTLESCIEVPTVCTSEGTSYTTTTSSVMYITSTACETNVYTPHIPGYTAPPTPQGTGVPPVVASTGYPAPAPSANSTSYAPPTIKESTGGAANNAPCIVGIVAMFGLLAAFF